ncbi:M20/M25/M40 family metallo-hydrolase [Arthrobacter globiformis]|uniref:M20/M25/M40 family metallo-hydrolase n=1 Tax=Arthrobacter globiformis TaxID=1665 RepID=UPI00277E29E6|nr:M20/M25/M40 family metallo-hydrolase [Arthrobacter globiformis]MDQ0866599.1 acetylornithine deacetylase/succinyl-diaminopimelate desuccinylase-like protein [Arthrobacter globiformis]
MNATAVPRRPHPRAEWAAAPGSPTVLIYSHHDVRAVKEENWDQTSPFDPVLQDGRLYGRGSSDGKGQVMAHIGGSLHT